MVNLNFMFEGMLRHYAWDTFKMHRLGQDLAAKSQLHMEVSKLGHLLKIGLQHIGRWLYTILGHNWYNCKAINHTLACWVAHQAECQWTNEWMNEWMNKWMNEWMFFFVLFLKEFEITPHLKHRIDIFKSVKGQISIPCKYLSIILALFLTGYEPSTSEWPWYCSFISIRHK